MVAPEVPTPAPAEISPVGFSVIFIFISLNPFFKSITSNLTSLKKLSAFKLFTDFKARISL
jgi:hypothetical protein